jgi:hypothetical protein
MRRVKWFFYEVLIFDTLIHFKLSMFPEIQGGGQTLGPYPDGNKLTEDDSALR